uniref:Cytokinesis protein sepH n=1 Tax=Hirondellea gigas TaxID=1518452 RepID=A0A6A7GAQ7_9CRUS
MGANNSQDDFGESRGRARSAGSNVATASSNAVSNPVDLSWMEILESKPNKSPQRRTAASVDSATSPLRLSPSVSQDVSRASPRARLKKDIIFYPPEPSTPPKKKGKSSSALKSPTFSYGPSNSIALRLPSKQLSSTVRIHSSNSPNSPLSITVQSSTKTRDEPEFTPERSVGVYQIGDSIGKGAMGTVHRCFHTEEKRIYAMKRIQTQDLSDVDIQGIEAEIGFLHNFNHRNIVIYKETIQEGDYLNIILEYVENGSLSTILKKFGGRFPESLVAIFISQVLSGLQYLHSQNVIHRDIKCANILATKNGVMKVADFGVATRMTEFTKVHSVVGTPYWMAPEIISIGVQSTACDIWSLGCITIELLTGAPPYFHLQAMPAMFHIVQDSHPPMPEGVSDYLRSFLMNCFVKDPKRRVTADALLGHRWLVPNEERQMQNESVVRAYTGAIDSDAEMIAATIKMNGELLEENMTQQRQIYNASQRKSKAPAAQSHTRITKLRHRIMGSHSSDELEKAPKSPPPDKSKGIFRRSRARSNTGIFETQRISTKEKKYQSCSRTGFWFKRL